ncbi:hypothetical protein MRS44_014391 [Fusarium solani]|uniref:uncharacterized protein n=1 Tax=Fusarium solani TaxID=169388 RepID=UPI0032C40E85|nr:hypothetical protein MRS44_014391 [Fusarium solani]
MESPLEEAFMGFEERTQRCRKPMVIGLYGISGSGKSFLMNHLKNHTLTDHFAFYEGSDMIASLVPGGLETFQALGEQRKAGWRGRAIEEIKKDALANKKIAVVTAHFMFWSEEQVIGQPVYTLNDFSVFTHIIYLNTPPELVSHRRLDDKPRDRHSASIEHLKKWQEAEIVGLRHLCPQHGILFHVLTHPASLCSKALAAVAHFCQTNIAYSNHNNIVDRVENLIAGVENDQLETALVLDADKTLTPMDTGVLFWQTIDRFWFKMLHATDKDATRLLMFPMKDAATACPAVMDMKQRVGLYLATEFVTQLIGLEEYFILEEPPDEIRNELRARRLFGEEDTLIMGVMGDGRSMARGVREAFPSTMLIFAASTSDIADHDVHYKYTVILVDSSINSGQTMIRFIRHIRNCNPRTRIVVMTGAVQAKAIERTGALRSAMQHSHSSLVALTVLEDKPTGTDN